MLMRRIFQTYSRPIIKTTFCKSMSTNSDFSMPSLMNFNVAPLPKLSFKLKNSFFSNVIIRPYFDQDFSQQEFIKGATRAAVFVSSCLANSDFDTLRESQALTDDCLRTLILNMARFDSSERQLIKPIDENSILNQFIYQIGIMFDDENQSRHVEITFSLHCLPDFSLLDVDDEFQKMGLRDINGKIRDMEKIVRTIMDHPTGPIVHTYRFIRNYTKGQVDDSWTINALNHASLSQLGQQ